MKKGEECKDKTRNNRFAEALDYLRRTTDIKTQKQLAKQMGVSKDTITRIMHAYTPLTEDAITKFQIATGCIFNLQWLRGESDVMMANEEENVGTDQNPHQSAPTQMLDYSSLMNATISAQSATIASLKRELADKEESTIDRIASKDETIKALREQIATKDAFIEALRLQIADLRATIARQQTKEVFGNYPHAVGVAEDMSHHQYVK